MCNDDASLYTHLNLNALKMRSTSVSRWNSDASLLRSFSSSRSVAEDSGFLDDATVEEEAPVDIR